MFSLQTRSGCWQFVLSANRIFLITGTTELGKEAGILHCHSRPVPAYQQIFHQLHLAAAYYGGCFPLIWPYASLFVVPFPGLTHLWYHVTQHGARSDSGKKLPCLLLSLAEGNAKFITKEEHVGKRDFDFHLESFLGNYNGFSLHLEAFIVQIQVCT